MLDEKALRRPDFRGGVAVQLADGQEWFVPRPSVLWTINDDESDVSVKLTLSPEFDAAREGLKTLSAPLGYMKLFLAMLRVNYEISPAAAQELLVLDLYSLRESTADDAEVVGDGDRLFRDLYAIATGGDPAPKP